jgi:hypothetical protein
MPTDSRLPSAGSVYATRPIAKVVPWHGFVVCDLLLNSLTAGLYLIAAIGELVAPADLTSVSRMAYPVVLGLLLADLFCLVIDLGDPRRFHYMLRVFKLGSPMSVGVWSLTCFAVPVTLIVASDWLSLRGPVLEALRKWILLCGLFPALATAAYKGVLLSTSSQAGWKDARWLGGYLTSSAFPLGCAELLVLAIVFKQEGAVALLRSATLIMLLLSMIPTDLLIGETRPTLMQRYNPRLWSWHAVMTLGSGIAVPMVLLALSGEAAALLAATAFMVSGSFAIRFGLVDLVHAGPQAKPSSAQVRG